MIKVSELCLCSGCSDQASCLCIYLKEPDEFGTCQVYILADNVLNTVVGMKCLPNKSDVYPLPASELLNTANIKCNALQGVNYEEWL